MNSKKCENGENRQNKAKIEFRLIFALLYLIKKIILKFKNSIIYLIIYLFDLWRIENLKIRILKIITRSTEVANNKLATLSTCIGSISVKKRIFMSLKCFQMFLRPNHTSFSRKKRFSHLFLMV
jgi:hypothetical protein